MRIEESQGHSGATAEQILGEIRDYCRETQTAESTFGRLVVNDGKLVSRLRDGAKITTGTLDKVRAYLTEHRTARRQRQASRSQSREARQRQRRCPGRSRRRASDSSTTARNICCSSRPAARRPRSATGFRSNSAICSRRRRRCGFSMPGSATAPCCRG